MKHIDERIFSVTRHGAIAPPLGLRLTMIFSCRYWIFLVLVFFSAQASPAALRWLANFPWVLLLFELPILLLVAATIHRSPGAHRLWRKIWQYGRALIVATALLHLLYVGWELWSTDVWRRWPELFLASCALLDVSAVYGIYKDPFYTEVFADFPAEKA